MLAHLKRSYLNNILTFRWVVNRVKDLKTPNALSQDNFNWSLNSGRSVPSSSGRHFYLCSITFQKDAPRLLSSSNWVSICNAYQRLPLYAMHIIVVFLWRYATNITNSPYLFWALLQEGLDSEGIRKSERNKQYRTTRRPSGLDLKVSWKTKPSRGCPAFSPYCQFAEHIFLSVFQTKHFH